MKQRATQWLGVASLFGATSAAAQTLYPNAIPNVTPVGAVNAAQYLAGPNVSVSNVTYSGHPLQVAVFNEGLQALGYAEGIVFTTGNSAFAGSFGNGNPGDQMGVTPTVPGSDSDLDVLNETASINNEVILEFDFVTTGTSISFKYLFGSDEYLEYIASGFNDAFGFFLSGPGIDGPFSNGAINLAMVNGVPVSVNGVNPLNGNAEYFFDNMFVPHLGVPTVEGVNAQLQYDGFTWGLIATATVQCNQVYHIKLAICNSGDSNLDSGVFIERGGLKSPHSPPGPLTIAPSPVCAGEPVTLTVAGDPNATYTWSTGQSGVGLQSITVPASLNTSTYSVTAEYLPGCTLSTASLAQQLTVHNPENVPPQCLGVNGTGEALVVMNVAHQTCFTIPTSDTPNERVVIEQSGGDVPGGVFIDNNGFQETGQFCWTPGASHLGFHTLEVTASDRNVCEELDATCTVEIKVICDYCPIDVYYEGRAPEENPLPAETVAGGSISAGFNVDPAQQNGFVWTGNEDVLFRAPVINLESGFTGGPGFQAIIDPNTCLEDCNDCCTNWSGFTVDTYSEGNTNVFEYPFSPNGDGVNDVWQVFDMDNAYCAYGATSFTLWISSRWGGEPVWLLFGFSPTCCQFDSWAPDRPGVVSSIYWDGTVNFGTWHDHGEYVPSTEYEYILDLYGCGGALAHYTGYIGVFDSPGPSGMMLQDSIPTAQSSDSRPQPSVQPEHAVALGGGPTPPAFFVAPNPASDFVFVEYGPGLSVLRIFDSMGRSVREVSPANATHHLLDVSALASGTYVLRALATDGSIHQRTVIKQ